MALYLEHFNLRELPFRITPAVDYFYRGCVRGEILEALKYAISNGEGIITVTGEVGTGKSMLCRVLMTDLADGVELVYIANPSLTHAEIVYHIAEELGLGTDGERHQVTGDLQRHLLKLHGEGRRVLVCIDEAQAMPDESLEQLRLLSNIETATDKVVQIVMFGQPELADKLARHHMRQLRERITSSFTLKKLDTTEVGEYIEHRLRSAGLPVGMEVFNANSVSAIAKVSEGIARRINILCDKAMLAAFAGGATTITPAHVRKAAHDARYRRMDDDPAEARTKPRRLPVLLAGIAALAAVIAIIYQVGQAPAPAPAAAPATPAVTTVTVAGTPPPPATVTVTRPAPPPQPMVVTVTREPLRPLDDPATLAAAANPLAHGLRPASQRPTLQAVRPIQPEDAVATVDNPHWAAYPPSSYLRQRLNATETLFGTADDAEQYTARILTVPRGNAIATERYLRDLARFFAIRNVLVYPARDATGDVFVLSYGIYPSEFQAELFIHELPSFFRSGKPFVQAVAVARLEAGAHW